MNRTIAILLLLLGIGTAATLPAADSRIYATITITTNPATGSNLVVNTATRSWTTNVTDAASQIEVTTGISEAQTNLFNHLASYPIGGSMALWGTSTNDVRLMAQVNSNLTVSFGGTWATVTYSTNYIERSYTVTVPYTAVTNLPYRTNMASALVDWISLTTTTTVPVTATAFEGYVNTNGNQTINGAKVFAGTLSGTIGTVSNGVANGTRITNVAGLHGTLNYLTNGVLHSPTLTNGVNYGNAFRSPGSGANSEQVGTSAAATGQDSLAIGNSATASDTADVAIGYQSQAVGSSGIAIGSAAATAGSAAIAIGPAAAGTGANSIAIGNLAEAMHDESIVLGGGLTTTAEYQILMGTADHTAYIPGTMVIGNVTNAYLTGTNHIAGAWSASIGALSVNGGANNKELTGETVFTIVAGGSLSSGSWTLDGLYPGWQGRTVRLINLCGFPGTVEHASGLVATTNQIVCPGSVDMTLGNGYSLDLIWNSGQWRALPVGSVPTTVGDLTVTGNITLTNTVYDDCVVALDARSGPAGAEPTFAAFAGPVFAWEFSGSASNALYFSLQLPHRYKHGSDLLPHIHWTKTTGTADAVIWGLDYVMASINSNFVTTATTIYTTNTCPTSMQHKIASFPTISGTNFSGSAVMMGKIYRLGDVDADTGTAWGLMLDVHYEADKLGSDSETP